MQCSCAKLHACMHYAILYSGKAVAGRGKKERYPIQFSRSAANFCSLRSKRTQFRFMAYTLELCEKMLPSAEPQRAAAQKTVRRSLRTPGFELRKSIAEGRQSVAWGSQPAGALMDGVEAARLHRLEPASSRNLRQRIEALASASKVHRVLDSPGIEDQAILQCFGLVLVSCAVPVIESRAPPRMGTRKASTS